MKSALIFESGQTQIVLTPETKVEEDILRVVRDRMREKPEIHFGTFYGCQGGWSRWSPFSQQQDSDSFILVFNDKPAPELGPPEGSR